VTDYEALLRALAVPRLVGTPNHARVREILKRELAARGLAVEEQAFDAKPSRVLLGTPPLVRGVNLIARRPGADPPPPPVWLVAHYDSKGQPISMAVRLAGAIALVLGAVGLLVTLVPALALLVVGGIVLSRNRVTDASPGAVDNASALVAALMVLDLVPRRADVGVVFPDAEELGLLGARALVEARGPLFAGAAVVNLDGLDDRGRPIAVVHRRGPVVDAVAGELRAFRARWMPVVVDGIALARAARECVTIMKGDWRTARIVHTPRDAAERLTLAGVRQVAHGVARAIGSA
jgi:hypothetical protein